MNYIKDQKVRFNNIEKINSIILNNIPKINQLYIDFIYELETRGLGSKYQEYYIDISSFYSKEVTLMAPYLYYQVDYNVLSDIANNMDYNGIIYKLEKSIIIEDYTFTLFRSVKAEIPKEELALLQKLGKIKEEMIPSRVETSVFCEF